MAEDQQDDSQKTEDPTQRRLEQAREKGQVARSQEIAHLFMILAGTLVIGVFGGSLAGGLVESMYRFVAQPHEVGFDGGQLRELMLETVSQLGGLLLLPAVIMLFAAFMASFVQNGLNFSLESIKPKLEKLSLVKGMKRLFSSRSVVEFLKGIAKITIVAIVVVVLLWPEFDAIPNIASMEISQFMNLIQALAVRVMIGVLSVMAVIAGIDFLYQKQQHLKQLRMSKQDLKDEFKQTEGDPMIKARLRQLRMERARKRMMAAVPEADVVVTNPTHFAIALKYDPETMQAPILTAKGVDSLALRIRELAEANDVPVVENPPVARALYAGVDLDQEIPAEHFAAVAGIIGYVMRLKGKLPGHGTARR